MSDLLTPSDFIRIQKIKNEKTRMIQQCRINDIVGTGSISIKEFLNILQKHLIVLAQHELQFMLTYFSNKQMIVYESAVQDITLQQTTPKVIWGFKSNPRNQQKQPTQKSSMEELSKRDNSTRESENQSIPSSRQFGYDTLRQSQISKNRENEQNLKEDMVLNKENINQIKELLLDSNIQMKQLSAIKTVFMDVQLTQDGYLSKMNFEEQIKHQTKIEIPEDFLNSLFSYLQPIPINPDHFPYTKVKKLIEIIQHLIVELNLNHSNRMKDALTDGNIEVRIISDQRHPILKQIQDKIEDKYASLQKAFRNFDLDKDGQIGFKEFLQGVNGIGVTVNDEEIKCAFEQLDIDGDGQINYDEFCGVSDGKAQQCAMFPGIKTHARQSSMKHCFIGEETPSYIGIRRISQQSGMINSQRTRRIQVSQEPIEVSTIQTSRVNKMKVKITAMRDRSDQVTLKCPFPFDSIVKTQPNSPLRPKFIEPLRQSPQSRFFIQKQSNIF